MTAIVTGLNLADALASLPRICDRDFASRLLRIAEAAFVAAINRKQE